METLVHSWWHWYTNAGDTIIDLIFQDLAAFAVGVAIFGGIVIWQIWRSK